MLVGNMRTGRIILYNIVYLSAVSEILANAEGLPVESSKAVQTFRRNVYIFPGVRLTLSEDDVSISLHFADLLAGTDVKGKTGAVKTVKKFGFIKKIGPMMMMLPLAMQILRLPGELAEIKVSLIRSIVVAKMAIIMIIFNAIRNARKPPVVVVQQPEVHEHFYNDFQQPEDEDEGWVG